MKSLQVKVPDRLHGRARTLAKREGLSVNQFLVTSLSHEIIRQETSEFFSEAAKGFSQKKFSEALASVPAVPPDKNDRLD